MRAKLGGQWNKKFDVIDLYAKSYSIYFEKFLSSNYIIFRQFHVTETFSNNIVISQ